VLPPAERLTRVLSRCEPSTRKRMVCVPELQPVFLMVVETVKDWFGLTRGGASKEPTAKKVPERALTEVRSASCWVPCQNTRASTVWLPGLKDVLSETVVDPPGARERLQLRRREPSIRSSRSAVPEPLPTFRTLILMVTVSPAQGLLGAETETRNSGGGGGWYPNPCRLTEAEPPLLLMFRVAL
jgi:hypothetical protein